MCVCVYHYCQLIVTFSMLCPSLSFVFLDKFSEQKLFSQALVDFNVVCSWKWWLNWVQHHNLSSLLWHSNWTTLCQIKLQYNIKKTVFLVHGGGADNSLLLSKNWSSQFSLTFESLINIYAVRPILCYTFTYTWTVQNWSVNYNLTEICIGQHCSLAAWIADNQLYLVLWIQHS